MTTQEAGTPNACIVKQVTIGPGWAAAAQQELRITLRKEESTLPHPPTKELCGKVQKHIYENISEIPIKGTLDMLIPQSFTYIDNWL